MGIGSINLILSNQIWIPEGRKSSPLTYIWMVNLNQWNQNKTLNLQKINRSLPLLVKIIRSKRPLIPEKLLANLLARPKVCKVIRAREANLDLRICKGILVRLLILSNLKGLMVVCGASSLTTPKKMREMCKNKIKFKGSLSKMGYLKAKILRICVRLSLELVFLARRSALNWLLQGISLTSRMSLCKETPLHLSELIDKLPQSPRTLW